MKAQGSRAKSAPRHLRRLFWLLACVSLGLAVALAGVFFTGSSLWYAAIPAAIALGWLFVADPTQCEPPARQRRSDCDRGGPVA
ncbi:hypothetical protein BURC_02883 [Burkholderiaceae bacterium]|nr:hypothetical protein BURC_02883 [Burkholderiaceae bacterium]